MTMKIALAAALAALLGTAANAQLGFVDAGRSLAYQQTGPGTLVSLGTFFSARAFTFGAGDFDGGTLTYPGAGSPQAMTPVAPDVLQYQSALLPDKATLDSDYPTGTYRFDLSNSITQDAASASLVYSADAFTAIVPALANFAALGSIDPALAFTFQLASGFTQAANANRAYTFLTVDDFTAGVRVLDAGFLSPSTLSVTLPGGSFVAGHDYGFELIFSNRIAGRDPDTIVFTEQLFDVRTTGLFSVAAPVPEPASWALMIAGFGTVGVATRRRTRALAALSA